MAETRSDAPKTKRVLFARDHIHKGVHYKAGDEVELPDVDAQIVTEYGSAGEKREASQRVDVVKG